VKRVKQLEVNLSVELADWRAMVELRVVDEIRLVLAPAAEPQVEAQAGAGAIPVGAGAAGATAPLAGDCAMKWTTRRAVRAAGGCPAVVDVPALPARKFGRERVNSDQSVASG
jgi:hypothetical protein